MTKTRFARWLAAITAGGLAVRVIYVAGFRRDHKLLGDDFFYHYGANLLVHGHGFIAPLQYYVLHARVQAAEHPPLYLLFLAIPSAFGVGTTLVHMVWSALLGTATVAATGLLGRRVAGERAGLIAAAIAAIYPNIWVYDGELLSETLAIFVATVVVLVAYKAIDSRTTRDLYLLGALCGVAALARSELVFLVPALLWPVAWRAGIRKVAVATLIAVAVTAPWIVYNLTRFEHPVFLSSQLEPTLAGANCQDTYTGDRLGLLTSTCLDRLRLDPTTDQSVNDQIIRAHVRTFIEGHLSRLPVVIAARVGRVLGVYRPAAQVDVDVALEGRERPVAIAGLVSGYILEIVAIGGIVVLRRRRRTVYPLIVLPVLVILTVAATYGTNRFRASAETSIVVLAAVAMDRLAEQRAG